MTHRRTSFDALRLSIKLRQIAVELRHRREPLGPLTLADRLEDYAAAMLRPEGHSRYQPFGLRAERLARTSTRGYGVYSETRVSRAAPP